MLRLSHNRGSESLLRLFLGHRSRDGQAPGCLNPGGRGLGCNPRLFYFIYIFKSIFRRAHSSVLDVTVRTDTSNIFVYWINITHLFFFPGSLDRNLFFLGCLL